MIPGTAPIPSGRFLRFLRDDFPENPRVVVLWVASGVLILVLAAVATACTYTIFKTGDLGQGACWALGLSIFGLGVLAGYQIGTPPLVVPGSTKTTSESVSTPESSRESTSTTVVDPVPPIAPRPNSDTPGSSMGNVVGCAPSAGGDL